MLLSHAQDHPDPLSVYHIFRLLFFRIWTFSKSKEMLDQKKSTAAAVDSYPKILKEILSFQDVPFCPIFPLEPERVA